MRPVLVCCAHGTRDVEGRRRVSGLVAAVAAARPDLDVRDAFVDVQEPSVGDVVASVGARVPLVVVPLLLAPGYHVHVDIARAVSAHGGVRADTLGPDPRLTELLHERLLAAHVRPEDTVVLAAAGSSDARSRSSAGQTAVGLALLRRGPVGVAYAASRQPSVPAAVRAARRRRRGVRVVVVSYLLAPGFFQRRLHDAGADVVTGPLLDATVPDPRLVELVVDRWAQAGSARRATG